MYSTTNILHAEHQQHDVIAVPSLKITDKTGKHVIPDRLFRLFGKSNGDSTNGKNG